MGDPLESYPPIRVNLKISPRDDCSRKGLKTISHNLERSVVWKERLALDLGEFALATHQRLKVTH